MTTKLARQVTRFEDLEIGQEFKIQVGTLNWEDEVSTQALRAVKLEPYHGYNCLGANGNGYRISDQAKVVKL